MRRNRKLALSPELDIRVKVDFPEFLALALRAHWIVAEDVQDVVVTSSESVQAAVFLRHGLQNLHKTPEEESRTHKIEAEEFHGLICVTHLIFMSFIRVTKHVVYNLNSCRFFTLKAPMQKRTFNVK